MGVEELLDMPPLREILGQHLNFIAVRCREERVEVVLLGPLSLPLNVLVERSRLAVSGGISQLRGRVASPARSERFGEEFLQLLPPAWLIGHRYQEVEVRLRFDLVQQFDREVLR